MTLAQLGADVTRVDPIGGAADYHRWPLTAGGESIYWAGLNKGKQSVAVEITVLLPPTDSRLLTRELLYTAVTRAREKVRLVGSADQLRAAVNRRAIRATGLSRRLAGGQENCSE